MKNFKCFLVILVIGLLGVNNKLSAQTYWTNDAGDRDWFNDLNWSTGVAPTVSDNVVFDDANLTGGGVGNPDCYIGGSASCNGFTISAGYTGTFTQEGNLDIGSALTMNGGTFLGSGSSLYISVKGSFDIEGGSFTSTDGDLKVKRSFKVAGTGSFNDGGGTVVCNSQYSGGTVELRTITFYSNVTFNNLKLECYNIAATQAYEYIFLVSSSLTVSGTLTLNTGTTGTNTRTLSIETGTINLNGGLTISGNSTSTSSSASNTGAIILSGSTTQTITGRTDGTYAKLCNIEFAGSSRTIAFGAAGQYLNIGGTFAISGVGNLTINTGTIIPRGSVALTNSGTAGGGSATISFRHGSGSLNLVGTTEGNCRLPKVIFNCSGVTVVLSNTISVANDFTYAAGTITQGTSKISTYGTVNLNGGSMSFNDLSVKYGTTTLTGNLDVNGILTISSGATLSCGSYTVNHCTINNNGVILNGNFIDDCVPTSGTKLIKNGDFYIKQNNKFFR